MAWSPDGQWLTYLVSPERVRSAPQLHAIRPDGTDHRALAGMADPETVFAGCVDEPAAHVRVLAGRRSQSGRRRVFRRRRDRCGPAGRHRRIPAGDGGVAGRRPAARPARAPGAPAPGAGRRPGRRRCPAAVAPPPARARFPVEGTDVAEDGRFSADGTTVYLRVGAGRERPALGAVTLDADGVPGRLRILAERTDADLDSYAILDQDTRAMLVWNLSGHSAIELRDLRTGAGHRVDIGRRVLPGWSVLPRRSVRNPGTHRTRRAAQPLPRRSGRPPGRRSPGGPADHRPARAPAAGRRTCACPSG